MKKAIIIMLVFIFTFINCLSAQFLLKKSISVSNSPSSAIINLVIDAGHGGIDAGTVGVDSSKEKQSTSQLQKSCMILLW